MKGKFNEIINGGIPVLIDFYADWFGPCKTLAPVIKDFAIENKGSIRIIKIDIDKNKTLAIKYNIKSIPTLILFKQGRIIWQHSGLQSKHQLENNLKNHLQNV